MVVNSVVTKPQSMVAFPIGPLFRAFLFPPKPLSPCFYLLFQLVIDCLLFSDLSSLRITFFLQYQAILSQPSSHFLQAMHLRHDHQPSCLGQSLAAATWDSCLRVMVHLVRMALSCPCVGETQEAYFYGRLEVQCTNLCMVRSLRLAGD